MSELADGWTWARISDITEKVPNVKPEDYPEKEFGYVDISSICNSTYRITEAKRFKGKDAPSRARRPIRPNDILFSNVRTYLRNIAIVPPDTKAEICSTGFTVLRPNAAVDAPFLFRYVLTNSFIDRVTPQQTGTHYPATSDRVVMSELIPLPPLNEQRRIVTKLEELLDKVEACQKRLARIPVILKRFRQSVLAAACSGRLTAEWREDEEDTEPTREPMFEQVGARDIPSSWVWKKLSDLTQVKGGVTKGRKFQGKKTILLPYLRVANVQDGYLDLREIKQIEVLPGDRQKYSLNPGDVLFTEGGDRDKLGRGTIWLGEIPNCIHQNHIFRARLTTTAATAEYLSLASKSEFSRQYFFANASQTVNLASINLTMLSGLPIPLPPLNEQIEIITRVASLFKFADQIEARYRKAQAQVDKLTQSILAKAFRGELVPTEAELARREGRARSH